MDSTRLLRIERHGSILLVHLVNPPHQFFTLRMIPELAALLDMVERDTGILVIAFVGAAPDAFLSHLDPDDLEALAENPDQIAEHVDELSLLHRLLLRLAECPALTIAAINGRAWGAGCEFALACDLRYIRNAEPAGLAMLEAVIGLTPGAGAAYRLRRLLGPSRAFHLLLTAKAVGAAEALQLGLVHEVLPGDEFVAAVLERARRLTFHTRASIQSLRRCAFGAGDEAAAEFRHEQDIYVECLQSETAQRRARHFIGRRRDARGGVSSGVPAFLIGPVFRSKPSLIVQALREYFQPERARGVSGRYCLQIEGPRGGTWTASVHDGTLAVAPGAAADADVTMIGKAKDWVDFITGRTEDIVLFVTNRIRVHGDLMRALEFESMFLDA